MLTLNSNKSESKCFKFIGADVAPKTTHLISDTTSLLTSNGDCEDTCSFYFGPSIATLMAYGESTESAGSIASSDCGGSSVGSSASVFTSGSAGGSSASFSSGCSYSCIS